MGIKEVENKNRQAELIRIKNLLFINRVQISLSYYNKFSDQSK